MGHKFSPQDLEFYTFIHKTLWETWDPIGVRDLDGPEDEYHSYLPQVYQILKEGASAELVTKYLLAAEQESMGLQGDADNCKKVAEILLQKRLEIFGC